MSQPKRTNGSPSAGVNLGLIITPMLDMSFQILAFFIMTYHPSAFEGQITGQLLPAKGGAASPINENKVVPPGDPDIGESVQVIVKAVPRGQADGKRIDGEPARISIQTREDARPRFVAGADERIAESYFRLKAALKQSQKDAVGKTTVRLTCDADLKHLHVMEIYDLCKGSGIETVGFVAPTAPKR